MIKSLEFYVSDYNCTQITTKIQSRNIQYEYGIAIVMVCNQKVISLRHVRTANEEIFRHADKPIKRYHALQSNNEGALAVGADV